MALLRRIFQQGNSPVVALPPGYLAEIGLDVRDPCVISFHRPKRGKPFLKVRAYDHGKDGPLDPRYDRD